MFVLLTAAWPSQLLAANDDLLGWLDRLLRMTTERGARYNSLAVTIDEASTGQDQTARVEIVTPEKLYMFGQVIALATGATESSRSKDRIWTVAVPVQVSVPTLGQAELAKAPSVSEAVRALRGKLAGSKNVQTTQFQFHRGKGLASLAGFQQVSFTLVLKAPSATVALEAMRQASSSVPSQALGGARVASVGSAALGTLSGTLIARAQVATAGQAPRETLESSVRQLLEQSACKPTLVKLETVTGASRIQFEATGASESDGWEALARLTALPGLTAFQILELRVDTRGQPLVSGLLYF
jgi:hypothetical protein